MINNKKIAITGHTNGIGKSLYEHFLLSNIVYGFSKSNAFDVSIKDHRQLILKNSVECDVFINNAYNNFDDSQLHMLMEVFDMWKGLDNKLIFNISSKWTNGDNSYSKTKKLQDEFIEKHLFNLPKIINIKPGLVDTRRVKHIDRTKLKTETVVNIIDFILQTRSTIGITSITFEPF